MAGTTAATRGPVKDGVGRMEPGEIDAPRDSGRLVHTESSCGSHNAGRNWVDQIMLWLPARGYHAEIRHTPPRSPGPSVSRETFSKITNSVLDEMASLMARPLNEGPSTRRCWSRVCPPGRALRVPRAQRS